MSEADDLRARIFDLVDERVCLKTALEASERCSLVAASSKEIAKITGALEAVNSDIATALDDFIAFVRGS